MEVGTIILLSFVLLYSCVFFPFFPFFFLLCFFLFLGVWWVTRRVFFKGRVEQMY